MNLHNAGVMVAPAGCAIGPPTHKHMKKLIKTAAILVLGLSLAGAPLVRGAYNLSIGASGGSSDSDGGDPSVPDGASVGWWAYAYGPASAWVSLGGTVVAYTSAPANGSDGGSTTTTSSGTISIRMGCQTYPGGSSGAGVTINW